MKKIVVILGLCLAFAAGAAFADRVRDWRDLDAVHKQVTAAIQEMERARAANHYDMQGHGVKAEEHLRAAERELHAAIESAQPRHPWRIIPAGE
jgi:hypothetical protein